MRGWARARIRVRVRVRVRDRVGVEDRAWVTYDLATRGAGAPLDLPYSSRISPIHLP